MAKKIKKRGRRKKQKRRRGRKRSRFSIQEILTLVGMAAAALALGGLLVFPNIKQAFQTSREVRWTVVASYAAGKIEQPRDLDRDAKGFLYTLDHSLGRVVRVDTRSGKIVETWPTGGASPLKEPFGLSVRPTGGVAVSDFGNSRIILMDAQGKVEKTFPGQYFGTRDVAVSRSGRLAVVDTGNHRIVFLNRLGGKVAEYGSRGSSREQLDEPRSIAYGPRGDLYVLDMRNRRYIRFDAGRRPVSWVHVDCVQKDGDLPYLSVSPRGRVAVSSRVLQAVDVFSAAGKPMFRLSMKDQIHPIGVTFNGEDSLYIADEKGRRIVLVQIHEKL